MSEIAAMKAPRTAARGAGVLRMSGAAWFIVAMIGHLAFAAYVIANYGGDLLRGAPTDWNKTLIHGIVPGDAAGNAVLAAHLLFAAIITLGGPLQLIPQVRRARAFHRWNGRVYLTSAVIMSVGGLHIVWTRGTLGGLVNVIAISLNAVLILACAAMTVRYALARRFDLHQRWATRLFLVVSGVWFFRVGMMAWIAINGGPVGVGEELDGPFAVSWAYGQYLLPLAVYELYVRAGRSGAFARFAAAGLVAALTVLTAGGVAMASLFMWLPRV